MKSLPLKTLAVAVAALAPLASQGSLLVGFHDFDAGSSNEGADVENGFSGTVFKSGVPSENLGGSSDNFYGSSDFQVLDGSPTLTQLRDGHVKVQAGNDVTFQFKNETGGSVQLGSLLFDAAYRDVASTVLSVDYQIGASPLVVLSENVGPMVPAVDWTAAINYADFAFSLIGITLAANETISFVFSMAPGAGASSSETIRLDNVALTAIPEPSSLLALGGVIGAGLLLRSRRRSVGAAVA